MTDQEKAEAAIQGYMKLDNSVAKALIVDMMTLLRNERQEVLALIKATVDNVTT